ncbi:MAG: TetR/AcrR family transcriptional regulator [Kurthia sp.]|nr:TetR/AcrR family transcriptional regulator [Candidatus Kurthia equi]
MNVDTKGLIIQVATDLFRKKSYLGVGISEILTACNLSKGAFYHHFPKGKEELLITCLYTMNETITNDMKAIFSRHETTVEAIESMLIEVINQYERDEMIIGYTFSSIVSEMGSLSEAVREVCENSYANIEGIYIAKLQADGFSKQMAKELALMINATIEGGIMLCLTTKTSKPLKTVSKLLPNLIKVVE